MSETGASPHHLERAGLTQGALPRVLWVDRVLWPYRRPLWSALGRRTDLTVAVFGEHEPNRPRFALEGLAHVTVRRLRTVQTVALRSSENPIYFAAGARDLVDQTRPDVVVLSGWESPAHHQVAFHAKRLGAAHVQFYGGTAVTHRFRTGPVAVARRRFFRGVDAVISYSQASSQEVSRFGVPQRDIFVGFNSVDVGKIAAEAAAARATNESWRHQGHRYITVAQLIQRKNLSSAIDAFSLAAGPDDELWMVGTGPLETQLRDQANASPACDRIRFLGFQGGQDLVALLVQADTLVLPSTEEVWGLVVQEALACGLHAVVSNRAGAATDVAGMRGVWIAAPSSASLEAAMRASRDAWSGPVASPEILQFTPERYADVALAAIMHAWRKQGSPGTDAR